MVSLNASSNDNSIRTLRQIGFIYYYTDRQRFGSSYENYDKNKNLWQNNFVAVIHTVIETRRSVTQDD